MNNIKIYLVSFLIVCSFLVNSEDIDTTVEKSKKDVQFAFIPVISYSKSFGNMFGFISDVYFHMSKKDTLSPPSVAGIMGMYYTNNTYAVGIFSKNYFLEDTWRATFFSAYGNINFQTFYVDTDVSAPNSTEGQFINYTTTTGLFHLEAQRKIYKKIYLGLQTSYFNSTTKFEDNVMPTEHESLLGIGVISEIDHRDNVVYPHDGFNSRIKTISYLKDLGSSSQYHKVRGEVNAYFPINKSSVLMGRVFGIVSIGNVPFSGQNVVGKVDLRGYTEGKYRANQVYDIQTEYRWNFYKKWGVVAFGGVGVAFNSLGDSESYSGLLPSIGAGVRYKAIPSHNVNVGIDVAAGKDDWGIYFRIGEAFTR